ncbi:hypothetical protein [Lacticaseibacillus paracasei]|uniref:hypothetical protein n=1 Tax=Lacticaseibacillus paracasei TaxID=1597 RepID=UPI001D4A18A7|nr:hypothetical protein [Lacticaseibacillus paracasei]MBM6411784.1 hypothetical protein [Lacticaseibacillus paracasei]
MIDPINVDQKWLIALEAKVASAPTPFFVSVSSEGGGRTAIVVERREIDALLLSARLMLLFRATISYLWLAVFVALGAAFAFGRL